MRRAVIAAEDEQRRHEQGDLEAAAHRDPHGEIKLVLARHGHRRDAFGSAADQRHDDDADEGLGETEAPGGLFHGTHQDLAQQGQQPGR